MYRLIMRARIFPGVGGLSLNMPQFSDIQVTLPDGVLEIIGGADGKNIGNMDISGLKHTSKWIDWKILKKGGTIIYTH